jgi:hypothetical protein
MNIVFASNAGASRRAPGSSGSAHAFVRKGGPSVRPTLLVAIFGAVIAQAIATASPHAQTLADPNPPPHASAMTALPENKQPKPCPAYGPGFVQLPGSGVCVKIGGSVQMQGSAH